MSFPSSSRFVRAAAVISLCLPLVSCGRRGPPELPPGAVPQAPAQVTPAETYATPQGASSPTPATTATPAATAAPPRPPRPFFLDPLL